MDYINIIGGLASIIGLCCTFYFLGKKQGNKYKRTNHNLLDADEGAQRLKKKISNLLPDYIDVIGYSVHALIDLCRPQLKDALANKKRVRILTLSTNSFGLKDKSLLEHKYHKRDLTDFRKRNEKHIEDMIIDMLKLANKVKYQSNVDQVFLLIREYDQFPYFRGIIWGENFAYIGNYLNKLEEPGRVQPHIFLFPEENNKDFFSYNSFKNYFNYIWNFRSRPYFFKGIIFDLYETLVFINPSEKEKTRKMMAKELRITYEEMNELWLKTTLKSNKGEINTTYGRIIEIQKMLGRPIDTELAESLSFMEEELIQKHCKVYPDTIETLEALIGKGYRLAVLSNCSKSSESLLAKVGLHKYFESIVFSFQIGHVKPEKEAYYYAAEKLNLKPDNCIFVGDGNNDELIGAKKIGMLPIMIDRKGLGRRDIVDSDIKVISSLIKLNEVIESIELIESQKKIEEIEKIL